MPTHTAGGCFLVGLICLAVATVFAQGTDEQAIRMARARSNAAIARHDLEGISGVWMEDIHVVSSTSAQGAGRDENRQRMARQFASRPDTTYVRRTTDVQVYAPWEVASERGEWTGTWTEFDGKVTIGGTYLAQWRKIGAEWLIQAELFVPVHCDGSDRYCRQRPR
jgi:ketosteroid isomerase-like protein